METEILNQLIWIKWLLIGFGIVLGIGLVTVCALLMLASSKMAEQLKSDIPFPERARALLDQGKPEEVIAIAEERASKFPADSQAHWFLGQACYRVGDLRRALGSLRKTQELQPDWESSYTGPLIRVIEEKLAKGTARPDLKVVTPIESFPVEVFPGDGAS